VTATEPTDAPPGVPITVDGREVVAGPGELLIDACERNGVYVPRFCYHPRMKPVGMCRMCLVEVDTGRGPALQPSCMLPCTPGMVVETESERTKKAQEGVLEFLLINHPLDCPVCDKGGECPLQDQTFAYGPGESRFVEEKRHYEKPIPISENVLLDRERCILCDRCTRFAKEVAGDPLIHFQGRGATTEVNTFPDDPFSSYFSGNTVQICPVGALTARPYRFKARPWDLEEVESTATVDSVGSRIAVQSSRNVVLRYLGVDSDAVNWGWLTDKERFAFEAWNHPDRLSAPLRRDADGALAPASWGAAVRRAAELLGGADPARIGVIGGARLSNEAQYLWARLLKGVLGTDNVDAQLDDGLPAETVLGLPRATIDDACRADGVVVLLGPDPKEELGSLYLRLRHAVVEDGVTLIECTPRATGLARHAAHRLHPRPGEVAALARALAGGEVTGDVAGVPADVVRAAAAALEGRPVTVVLGRASLAEAADHVVDAAHALAAIPGVRFLSALRRGNVHGALDMGLTPGFLPGRQRLDDAGAAFAEVWGGVPAAAGLDTAGILRAAIDGRIDVLVLLGADPLADVPDRSLAARALEAVGSVVAVDLFVSDSVAGADVVLAAAGPGEFEGSFTNLEGRVSHLAQKVTPPGTARADWILAVELATAMGADLGVATLDDIWDQLAALAPVYADVSMDRIRTEVREGILVPGGPGAVAPAPTEPPPTDAYTYRLVVTRTMYDLGVMVRHAPSLAGLAPGTSLGMHPLDADTLGLADGDEVTVSSPRASVTVAVRRDAGLPRGSVGLALHQPGVPVTDLIDADATVVPVRVERA
jgi:NADH-quinone oxidoreductase subunit G